MLTDSKMLLHFVRKNPGVRRWFVSRVFEGADDDDKQDSPPVLSVDLYFAPARKNLLNKLRLKSPRFTIKEAEKFLLSERTDHLEWWEDENFDILAHLALHDFRRVLDKYSSYPPDQPIEEGMVFIEISRGGRIRFTHFSFQARGESNQILKRLLDEQTGEEGEGAAGQA